MNAEHSEFEAVCPRAVELAASYLVRRITPCPMGRAAIDLSVQAAISRESATRALKFLQLIGFASHAENPLPGDELLEPNYVNSDYRNQIVQNCLEFAASAGVLSFFAQGLEYDSGNHILLINPLLVPWQYRGLRDTFRALGAFKRSGTDRNLWVIDGRFKEHFLRAAADIMPECVTGANRMGWESLNRLNALRSRLGREAEEWVLEWESSRLSGHPFRSRIDHVASRNVAAGYDIASFSSAAKLVYDRFIEVKSFRSSPKFHWSRQEIEVAKRLRSRYVLLLVDREKLGRDYRPIEIIDPYVYFFVHSSKYWSYEPQSYEFEFNLFETQ